VQVDSFTYDGAGRALVLPGGLPPLERLPLIVVGRNKTLRLLNVRIANAASLASCVQLYTGARLLVEASDGVVLLDSEDGAALGRRYQYYMAALQSVVQRAAGLQAGAAAAQRDYVLDVDVQVGPWPGWCVWRGRGCRRCAWGTLERARAARAGCCCLLWRLFCRGARCASAAHKDCSSRQAHACRLRAPAGGRRQPPPAGRGGSRQGARHAAGQAGRHAQEHVQQRAVRRWRGWAAAAQLGLR
jgi:hypothetical protein